MVRQHERKLKIHRDKMAMLFKDTDRGNDGKLSQEDFCSILEDSQVRLWLSSMELDTTDASRLFALLDKSGDGYVSLCELIKGVLKLKGPAKSLDLLVLLGEQRKLAASVNQLRQELRCLGSCKLSHKQTLDAMKQTDEPQCGTISSANSYASAGEPPVEQHLKPAMLIAGAQPRIGIPHN